MLLILRLGKVKIFEWNFLTWKILNSLSLIRDKETGNETLLVAREKFKLIFPFLKLIIYIVNEIKLFFGLTTYII